MTSASLSSSAYGLITVPSTSELIFADEDISLATTGILIEGAFRAGSPTCRLLSGAISITLHGERPASGSTIAFTYKGIVVQEAGTLALHGTPYYQTWSRLAATGTEGESTIFLQDRVNWQVGQEIVVTNTQMRDTRDWHQNEVHVISGLDACSHLGPNITAVHLASPLQYGHYGGKEYQAEVGLLSRTIIVQGSAADSEPTDSTPVGCTDYDNYESYPCDILTGFGGHIMAQGTGGASLQFSNVELYRMGQTNLKGHYPFHLHVVGNHGNKSYIEDSSIHHSFFKAVVIHGSKGSRASRNVAFDVTGSAFYLQDGVEEENTIDYNLAVHIHTIGGPVAHNKEFHQNLDSVYESINLIDPPDVTAAGFYISNAYNSFEGNAGVGGFACYHFPILPKPIFMHRAAEMVPKSRPVLRFDGNSCRSSGYWWARGGGIYVGGQLTHSEDNDDPYSPLVYNPGRGGDFDICAVNTYGFQYGCPESQYAPQCSDEWMIGCRIPHEFTNTKISLTSTGIQHWGRRFKLQKLEVHDPINGPFANVFGMVWIDQVLVTVRTNNTQFQSCYTPPYFGAGAVGTRTESDVACTYKGWNTRFWAKTVDVFQWYDTGQSHVVTNVTVRNLDPLLMDALMGGGPTGVGGSGALQSGSGSHGGSGCYWHCEWSSCVWKFISFSDYFVPQFQQAVGGITYENVDVSRIFCFDTEMNSLNQSTVSGRSQSLLDIDGTSTSGLPGGSSRASKPTIAGSTYANDWWYLDQGCEKSPDSLSRMWLCDHITPMSPSWDSTSTAAAAGQFTMPPTRKVVSMTLKWDEDVTSSVGNTACGEYGGSLKCNTLARLTHWGYPLDGGLEVKANSQITGNQNAVVVYS